MQAGADPSVLNGAGHDAAYEAEGNGKEEVVRWLLTEGKGLDAGLTGKAEEGVGDVQGSGEGLEVEEEGVTGSLRGEDVQASAEDPNEDDTRTLHVGRAEK